MMPNSKKVDDLRRDSRITVVNGQEHREPKFGDVKIYGSAREVADHDVRRRFGDQQYALIEWRPGDDVPIFAVDVESASYISFGTEGRYLRWPGVVERNDWPILKQPSGRPKHLRIAIRV